MVADASSHERVALARECAHKFGLEAALGSGAGAGTATGGQDGEHGAELERFPRRKHRSALL